MLSFTDMFLDYTKEAESPESFFRWASYTGIAAVLRDNVYLDLGLKKVWPNIYTILMARSAALRKSVPLQLIGDMVTEVGNTKIIMGRSTIQAVIGELGRTETHKETGKPLSGASAFLLSEELASFSPDDTSTIPLLTDLYDNHKEWSSRLVSSGKAVLKNTCISLLAATNEPFFKEVYTSLAIKGGLLGRTFIIRESKKRQVNSFMHVEFEDFLELKEFLTARYNPYPLIQRLKDISKLKGSISFEYEARKEYHRWYTSFDGTCKNLGDTGVIERIHWGVLKVAIVIAIGSSCELVLKKEHIEESIDRCIALLKNYQVLTFSAGKAESAEPAAILLTYLWENNGCSTHKEVLRQNWMHFDSATLTLIIATMTQAGMIVEKAINSEPGYFLTDKGKDIFRK